MKLNKEEKKMLIELICNEQTHMIIKHPDRYQSDLYKNLEKLKVKIKDMEGKIVTKFKINTFENAKYFNKEALLLESDVLIHSGRFIIDGKSLMGIFSLDLSKDLGLEIIEKKHGETEEFITKLKNSGIEFK